MRPAIWGLVFVVGCTCDGGGESPAPAEARERAAPEPSPAPEPPERDKDPFDDTDRFQVYGYDLSPYGSARGVWRSRETDGTELERRVVRAENGDALVTATVDGELQPHMSVHVVGDVSYALRHDRCRVRPHDASQAVRRLSRRLPLRRVEVPMYGLLGDGVPEEAAQPIDEDPPEGSLAATGRRFSYERTASRHRASVEGEVWLDDEGRPVRSEGEVVLTAQDGDTEPATARWEFEIVSGDDLTVEPPEGCERIVEQVALTKAFPRMEGAEVILDVPNSVAYRVSGATVAEAMAFYRDALVDAQGWTEERSKILEQTGTLQLAREGQRMRVIARRKDDGITILVSFAR